jgi:hypothetical protein
MVVAEDEVLCDLVTSTSIDRRITFSALGNVQLKGWTQPVPVYRPEAALGSQRQRIPGQIIGRDAERAILDKALRSLLNGAGQFVLVQGEAGIGKSRLLADLIERARSNDCNVYQGFATAIEKSTLYFAWREVLLQLIEVTANVDPAHVQEKLMAAISDEPQLLSWAPLLDDVIHVGFPQTELTQTIIGAARAASIEQVIVHLLRGSASRRPILLIFDDAHWFDDASMELLRSVTRRLPEILVVASRRSEESAQRFNVTFSVSQIVKLDGCPRMPSRNWFVAALASPRVQLSFTILCIGMPAAIHSSARSFCLPCATLVQSSLSAMVAESAATSPPPPT